MPLRCESLSELPEKIRAQAAGKLLGAAEKRNKYGNQKCQVNGIAFDSLKEARRYEALMEAQRQGIIEDLRLQVDFTLQEAYTTATGRRVRAIRYRADFVYKMLHGCLERPCCVGLDDIRYWSGLYRGAVVIEDVKSRGTRTKEYEIKRKLMADKGYEIREV